MIDKLGRDLSLLSREELEAHACSQLLTIIAQGEAKDRLEAALLKISEALRELGGN